MNCCNEYGDCHQGSDCPARVAPQKSAEQENMSGFFSREAMKEHSDFHLQPKRESLTDFEPMYYLQDTRGYVGNYPLWWVKNGNGYTTDLRKAEKYTLDDAMRQHRSRESDIPWLCSEIDAIQRPTVDVQDMPRSPVHQREVVKSVHSIKDGI
jgi:hypothetical protein